MGLSLILKGDIPSRGFCVWTDDILDETKWRDPILFDSIGIDQDVSSRTFPFTPS